MSKIKKGDTVGIITGKDKGRSGTVLEVLKKKSNPKAGLFVVVKDINTVKKHVKPNPQLQQPGGIVTKEMAMPISNVALIDPKTNEIGGKVGFKLVDDKKVRFFKKTGEVIDV